LQYLVLQSHTQVAVVQQLQTEELLVVAVLAEEVQEQTIHSQVVLVQKIVAEEAVLVVLVVLVALLVVLEMAVKAAQVL
jgi:hypothetical protein